MSKDIPLLRGQIYLATIPFKIEDKVRVSYCIQKECVECDGNNCKVSKGLNVKKIKKNLNKLNCDSCDDIKNSKSCKAILASNIQLKEIEQGKKTEKSNPINLITPVKTRPYLILRCNNKGSEKDFVYGVPCYSIKQKALENERFMCLLKNGKIPNYYYLDENTFGISKPSYIDLSYITPIHKNNLIDYKGFLDPIDLFEINYRLERIFDLRSFNNCNDIELLEKQKKTLEEEVKDLNTRINELKRINNNN